MLSIGKVFKNLLSYEVEVVVSAPVEEVFSVVADIPGQDQWLRGHATTTKKTSEGPLGVGSTFTQTAGWEYATTSHLTVTEFVPNERLEWESRETDASLIRYFFKLRPADAGTRVTFGKEFKRLGVSVVFLPVLAPVARLEAWELGRALRRMKKTLETRVI